MKLQGPVTRVGLGLPGMFALALLGPAAWSFPVQNSGSPPHTTRADEAYNYIAGLFERGLHSMVVSESLEFLEEHPRHARIPLVRYRLGQSLYEQQQYAVALREFKKLTKEGAGSDFPYHTEVTFRLGQCALELDDFERAATSFEEVAGKPEQHYLRTAAAFFAGEAYFRLEQFARAAQLYGDVLQDETETDYHRNALYGLAWSCYQGGNRESAAQCFELFLRRHPDDEAHAEMRYLLGECQMQLQQVEQALQNYLDVPQGEYLDDALLAAAFAAAQLKNSTQAALLFLRLESEAGNSPLLAEAQLHAGIHSYKVEQNAQAAEVLDRLLQQQHPQFFAEACYWRGLAARQLQGPVAALPYFERGVQANPEEELVHRILLARSDALFDAGRFEEAAAGYSGVQSEDALYSAAVAALNADQLGDAVEGANQLLSEYPDSRHRTATLLVRGESLFLQEKYGPAAESFAEVLDTTQPQSSATERPRALSRLAWCHFYQDRFERAAQRFGQLVQEYPLDERSAEASALRGRSLLRAGKPAAAAPALQHYLATYHGNSFDDDARYDLSQCHLQLGNTDRAAKTLQKLASAENTAGALAIRALLDHGELLAQSGDHEKAVVKFAHVVQQAADPELQRPALYALAWSAFELARLPQARGALGQLLKQKELDRKLRAPALELAAAVERAAGDGEAAHQAYEELLQIAPESPRTPEVALVAAMALKEQQRLEAALRILEDAEQRWPRFHGRDRIVYERAFLLRELQRSGSYRDTLARFEEEFADSSLRAEAAFHHGDSLFEEKSFEAALQAYQPALAEASPVADLAQYKSGWCHFERQDWLDAAQAFREVGRRFPESPVAGEALYLCGESLYREGRFEQACQHLEAFLQQHPDHEERARGLFRLGLCLGELDRFPESLRALTDLQDADPEFPQRLEADLWQGRALLATGRLQEAQQHFSSILERDRSILAARAHLGLGHCLRAEEDLAGALGEYFKVVLLFDNSAAEVAEALWHAGQCLEGLDDLDRAAAQYRELVERFPESSAAASAQERLNELDA